MDWKQVGQMIGPMAPTIGSLIGGFIPLPGGSAIGQMAGQMLANALGVDNTPEAVGAAIQQSGAQDKIAAVEAEAQAKWPALADIAKAQFSANAAESDSINATMRAELAQGMPWYHWRNLYGYSVGIEATATSWVILYSLVWNPSVFKAVSDSFSFFISWYGMRFGLLGYIHNQTTNEKIAAVTGEAPSVVKNIAKAIRGK